MNITVFIYNIDSAILRSKLLFFYPFGLILENIGVCKTRRNIRSLKKLGFYSSVPNLLNF